MSKIWYKDYSVEQINSRSQNTMGEYLGIVVTALGPDWIEATMPVNERTMQPNGLLHGGASVVLAETLASTAGNLTLDPTRQMGVGLEINANHIRSCTGGVVRARATPFHKGSKTQVWDIRIFQDEKVVCVSRMTLAVLEKAQKWTGPASV
jgi:1,4-dihydroxy-2-naphthoyl-CoA hydrolase